MENIVRKGGIVTSNFSFSYNQYTILSSGNRLSTDNGSLGSRSDCISGVVYFEIYPYTLYKNLQTSSLFRKTFTKQCHVSTTLRKKAGNQHSSFSYNVYYPSKYNFLLSSHTFFVICKYSVFRQIQNVVI